MLTKLAALLIPFILIYGFYVQVHGDFGPGGGFQAGVILASAYILYALVHGVRRAQRLLPRKITDVTAPLGVVIYAGVGVVTLLQGGHLLDYDVLDPQHTQHAQEWGMFLVEAGVGLTVASVMATIFNEIAEQ
ncbi:MAG: Na(+)/H(+) antiporter subunit B [Planctomycetes bacterium]|nr:Na(+)/H(+) antiporter subunit B [Planctomycetota bacterium]